MKPNTIHRIGPEFWLRRAGDAGASQVDLTSAPYREAANRLYQRLGFEQLRVRDNYYGPGRHALILKRYEL